MTEPLTSPEMLIQRERLLALAKEMFDLADDLEHDEHLEDAEYTAGMMRLQAQQVRDQAEALEDDDDLTKVDLYVSRNELEIRRLKAKLTEAQEAHERGEHHEQRAQYYTRRETFWRIVTLVATGIVLFNLGFAVGQLVQQ